jgi:hypothetical protein
MDDTKIDSALDRLSDDKFVDVYVTLGKLQDLRVQQQILSEKLRNIVSDLMNNILTETKDKFKIDVDMTLNEIHTLILKRGISDLKIIPNFSLKIWDVTGNLSDTFNGKYGELPLSRDISESIVEFFNQRYERK